jgi:hypothetical protein
MNLKFMPWMLALSVGGSNHGSDREDLDDRALLDADHAERRVERKADLGADVAGFIAATIRRLLSARRRQR